MKLFGLFGDRETPLPERLPLSYYANQYLPAGMGVQVLVAHSANAVLRHCRIKTLVLK